VDYIQYLQVILSTSFVDNYIRLNIDRNDYDDGNDDDDDGNDNDDDGNYDNDTHNDDKNDWDDDNDDGNDYDDSVRTGAFNFIHCH